MSVYYDDYWAAGWMERHFGIRFGGELQPSDGEPLALRRHAAMTLRDIKYPLLQDCLSVFEAAPGDSVRHPETNQVGLVIANEGGELSVLWVGEQCPQLYEPSRLGKYEPWVGNPFATKIPIVARDGIVFHWPKVDTQAAHAHQCPTYICAD